MAAEAETNNNNDRRKKVAFLIMTVMAVVSVVTVFFYMQYKKTHISTDDAYVTGRIHVIASKVPGTVKTLLVQDNQSVKKGEVLLEIDESDYDVRVREAEAALGEEKAKLDELVVKVDVAKKQLSEQASRISSARAHLRLQEANLKQASADLERAERLFAKEIIPSDQVEKARTAHDVTSAGVDAAREDLKQAEIALETRRSLVVQAEAALNSQGYLIRKKEATLESETLRQGYTKIESPVDGYVTKRSVEAGNQVQAGQPLLTVVPLDDVWVVANYKETQVKSIRPGQKVKIRVDAFDGKTFEGAVHSIMAGTGSVFSLFPPENATGSYVKVVQRIPVKIELKSGTDPEHILRVGMSVVPTVLVD
jgi:membrane fusion protein (multidrug efflux system)